MAKRTIISVFLLVPIFCIPNYLSFAIRYEQSDTNVLMYNVGFSKLANEARILKTFHFWMFSCLTKVVPCVLLTFFTTVLIKKLLSARERRLRLATYGHSQQHHHSIVGDSQTNIDSNCDLPMNNLHKDSQQTTKFTNQKQDQSRNSSSLSNSIGPKLSLPCEASDHRLQTNENENFKFNSNSQTYNNPAGDIATLRNGVAGENVNSNLADEHANHHFKFQENGLVSENGLKNQDSDQFHVQNHDDRADDEPNERCGLVTTPPGGPVITNIISASPCVTPPSQISVSPSRDLSSLDNHLDDDGGDDEHEDDHCDAHNGNLASSDNKGNRIDASEINKNSGTKMSITKSSLVSQIRQLDSSQPVSTTIVPHEFSMNCAANTRNNGARIIATSAKMTTNKIPLKKTNQGKSTEATTSNMRVHNHRPPSPRSASTCGGLELYGGNPTYNSFLKQTNGSEPGVQASASCQDTNNIEDRDGNNNSDPNNPLQSNSRAMAKRLSDNATVPNHRGRSMGSTTMIPLQMVKIQATQRQLNQNETTTKLLIAVMIVFLICEFPAGILAALCAILGQDFFENVYEPTGSLMDLLALINSSVNFILYCFMSTQFRVTFYRVVLHCPAPNAMN